MLAEQFVKNPPGVIGKKYRAKLGTQVHLER